MAGPRWVNPALVLCSLRDYLNALLSRCLGREHPFPSRVPSNLGPLSLDSSFFVLHSDQPTVWFFGIRFLPTMVFEQGKSTSMNSVNEIQMFLGQRIWFLEERAGLRLKSGDLGGGLVPGSVFRIPARETHLASPRLAPRNMKRYRTRVQRT